MATINLSAGVQSNTSTTLTANTADTVNFSLFTPYIEIETDGAAVMVVTTDGSAPDTGAGATGNQYVFPASAAVRTIRLGPSRGRNPSIQLKSTGTPAYTLRTSDGK